MKRHHLLTKKATKKRKTTLSNIKRTGTTTYNIYAYDERGLASRVATARDKIAADSWVRNKRITHPNVKYKIVADRR
jgi:uncharacterized protein YcfL